MKSTQSHQLTLFAEVSLDDPVSPFPSPGNAKAQQMTAGSGRSFTVPFAKLSPDGSWWKMFQGFSQSTLDGSLVEYCETWPKAGILLNGKCYPQRSLGRRTCGLDCFLWRTPSAQLAGEGKFLETLETVDGDAAKPGERAYNPATGKYVQITLNRQVQMWPTPTSRDYRSPGLPDKREARQALTEIIGGQLNPTFVEYLMGFPKDWTNIGDMENGQECQELPQE